jgi:uncharacterized membrane protein
MANQTTVNETEKQQQRSRRTNVKESQRGAIYSDDTSHYSVTIGKPVEHVFEFFRNFENLSYFMKDLKDVKILSPKKSHWVIELEMGVSVEWDAEIVSERQNEMIAWKNVEGSEVETTGSVWFRPAPAGLGTIVSLLLDYKIPGGKVSEWLTKFMGEDPDSLSFINLRRLKAYLETGEIATIKGQASGRAEDSEPQQKH